MNPIKYPLRKLSGSILTLCAILGGVVPGHSQNITVQADSTKTWLGYINVYSTNGGYIYGQAFGVTDLRARFAPAQTNAARIILNINTNTYAPGTGNPPDTNFWNLPDGTPNKNIEANFYVDVGMAFAGNDVTFEGVVESNSLPAGWTCEAVIKQFGAGYSYVGDSRDALVGGNPFSITRTIPAGNICQYGFLFYGPNTAPNSPDSLQGVSIFVNNADPAITLKPVNQRALLGGSTSFSVVAVGGSPLSYQWQRFSTNLVNTGGKFSGATSPTLTISNAQFTDATTYSVIVTDTAGSATNTATLRVLTPAQFANGLDNPSFELDVVAPTIVPDPWVNFTGSALQNTNDQYNFSGFYVETVQGTNVVQVYNAGQYNGIYQDVPAAPGDVFTGDGWLWQSSYDPLLATVNEAYLEVQFRHGEDAPIAIYHSILVTNDPGMLDTWLFLKATNGVPAGYASTSTTNATYLVAPAGTDHVRYQITLHAEGGGSGSVYVDAMSLMKKIPVTVTTSLGGGNVTLSWLTQGATGYEVVYKDDLNAASWTSFVPAEVVAGDGTVKSKSFPTSAAKRFYSVLTK